MKDDGNGKLVADEGSALVQTAEFENTYSKEGEGEIKVAKSLVGRDWTTKDSFEFTITGKDGAPMPERDKVTVTSASTAYTESFGKIEFAEAGTYVYTVSETHKGETIKGVTYDSEDKTVTIKVKDDGKGGLIPDGTAVVQTASFENTYSKSGEGEIKVQKVLDGRDWKDDDKFTFTLTPADANTPMPTKDQIEITKADTDQTKSFGKIKFTAAGTYNYTVKETKGDIKGVTYDTADHAVTIKVKDDGEGHLVADDTPLIQTTKVTNTYKSEKPFFEKKIQDKNDSTGEVSGWQDSADYDINDSVPFKLSAKLASDVSAYRKYHVTIEDQMEESLDFESDSVKVYLQGRELDTADYEFNYGAHDFSVKLSWNGGEGIIGDSVLGDSLNDATVDVLFTAKLNSKAKLGSEGNINGARLRYSSNPADYDDSDESEEETPWDYVIAFTYQLDVNKLDPKGQPLEGAEFKLEKVIKDEGKKELELSVSGNTFSAVGLDDGDYVLAETRAPKGHRPIDPITFTVTADHTILWNANNEGDSADFNIDTRTAVLTALTGARPPASSSSRTPTSPQASSPAPSRTRNSRSRPSRRRLLTSTTRRRPNTATGRTAPTTTSATSCPSSSPPSSTPT